MGPALIAAALTGPGLAGSAGAESDFLLTDRGLRTEAAAEVVIERDRLTYRDAEGRRRERPLAECLALAVAGPVRVPPPGPLGVLVVSDGQRLPGVLAAGPPAPDLVAWVHPWLQRIEVPLDRVSAVTFRPQAPVPVSRGGDVVVLVNGDRLEGFVVGVGDPVAIEPGAGAAVRRIEIPLERAAALALVTPRQEPEGLRVWFDDGTVLDANRLEIGDDGYLRMATGWTPPEVEPVAVRLADVTAILFDPRAMVPLARLKPSGVEGSPLRYVVPAPQVKQRDAPLGLGRIEYRGPLLVRYALPAGARRFAAAARVPEASRTWGDFDLVVRDDDREVYRRRLNGRHPADAVNLALRGSELTIELTPGEGGPIHDRLILDRAMLLVER